MNPEVMKEIMAWRTQRDRRGKKKRTVPTIVERTIWMLGPYKRMRHRIYHREVIPPQMICWCRGSGGSLPLMMVALPKHRSCPRAIAMVLG
jgi:hypothetical protein